MQPQVSPFCLLLPATSLGIEVRPAHCTPLCFAFNFPKRPCLCHGVTPPHLLFAIAASADAHACASRLARYPFAAAATQCEY